MSEPIYSVLAGKPGTLNVMYVETMLFHEGPSCYPPDNPSRTTSFNNMTTWLNNLKSWMQNNGWTSVTTEITQNPIICSACMGPNDPPDCDFWGPVVGNLYGKPQDGKTIQLPSAYDNDFNVFMNNSLNIFSLLPGDVYWQSIYGQVLGPFGEYGYYVNPQDNFIPKCV